MEDKLVTLAILTYAKAQILKNVLENEGIEAYIHNVNLIQPVISSESHAELSIICKAWGRSLSLILSLTPEDITG